jgi:hypothetical protein
MHGVQLDCAPLNLTQPDCALSNYVHHASITPTHTCIMHGLWTGVCAPICGPLSWAPRQSPQRFLACVPRPHSGPGMGTYAPHAPCAYRQPRHADETGKSDICTDPYPYGRKLGDVRYIPSYRKTKRTYRDVLSQHLVNFVLPPGAYVRFAHACTHMPGWS